MRDRSATWAVFFLALLLSLGSIFGAIESALAEEAPPSVDTGAPVAVAHEVAVLPPLGRFVAAARTHALDNRRASAAIDEERAGREAAVLDLLPALSAVASYTRNQTAVTLSLPDGAGGTRTVTTTPLNQVDATLKAEATLLDLPAITQVTTADRAIEASRARAESTVRATERAVTQAYFDRVAAGGIEEAAERALEASRASLAVTQERQKADLASDVDVDRATAEVERRAQTLAEARLGRRLAERKLRTLTGLAAEGRAPDLAVDLTPPQTLGTSLEGAQRSPSVLAARADERWRDARDSAALAAFAPRITAQATERFTNAVGFGTSPVWAVGVSAEWRLDPSAFGARRKERAALESARVARLVAESDAAAAIEDAHEEVIARIARAKAADAEAVAAAHAARSARARVTAGTGTQLDLILAERDAFDADVSRVQGFAELARSRALLELASRPGGAP